MEPFSSGHEISGVGFSGEAQRSMPPRALWQKHILEQPYLADKASATPYKAPIFLFVFRRPRPFQIADIGAGGEHHRVGGAAEEQKE